MSSPEKKNRTAAIVVGVVLRVIFYLLSPPLVGTVLLRVYGNSSRVPLHILRLIDGVFAPAEWLAEHSKNYRAIRQYESRLVAR